MIFITDKAARRMAGPSSQKHFDFPLDPALINEGISIVDGAAGAKGKGKGKGKLLADEEGEFEEEVDEDPYLYGDYLPEDDDYEEGSNFSDASDFDEEMGGDDDEEGSEYVEDSDEDGRGRGRKGHRGQKGKEKLVEGADETEGYEEDDVGFFFPLIQKMSLTTNSLTTPHKD